MAMRRVGLSALVAVLYLIMGFVVRINADETSVDIKRAELVTAAHRAFAAIEADFKQNRVVVDDVYMWSRRLMQAEQLQGTNANAAAEHTKRMSSLNDYVVDLTVKNPERAGNRYLQTKYYLLEAEVGQATQ